MTVHQEAIVRLRSRGLTQAAIAAELGVSQPSVSVALRRAEGRAPGQRVLSQKAVINAGVPNTEQPGARLPIPRRPSAVIFEQKRGPWERFRNSSLENLAMMYEALRERALLSGSVLDDRFESEWAKAYGRNDLMRAVIRKLRVALGLPSPSDGVHPDGTIHTVVSGYERCPSCPQVVA